MKWISQPLILMALSLGLLACGSLNRHPKSGYASRELSSVPAQKIQDLYQARRVHEFQQASEELGYNSTYALSLSDRQRLSSRVYLNRLEASLKNDREKKQYYHYKPMMKTDVERIQFLRLPNMAARERFAAQRGLQESRDGFSEPIANLIEEKDVAVGMDKKAVIASWGDPDVKEVAGDPIYGNERWKYSKFVSSSDGYRKELRYIYFEGGRVVGWETF